MRATVPDVRINSREVSDLIKTLRPQFDLATSNAQRVEAVIVG